MITPNVLNRTFHLKCGARRGSCFSLDVDGRQYVLTAAHVVKALKDRAVVEILHGGKWKPLDVVVVGYGPPQVDVAVLALKFRITLPELILEPTIAGLTTGQDAYCLGFPHGEWGGGAQAQKFPVPFVKKTTVSCLPDASSAARCLFLDGYSNPGFSGGPVVFRENKQPDLKVAAVVSSFQYEQEPVYLGNDQLHLSAQHNPDIIVSYDIKHALDLITLNPVGFELKEEGVRGRAGGVRGRGDRRKS